MKHRGIVYDYIQIESGKIAPASENWYGIDSTEGDSDELSQKEGALTLELESRFKATCTIRIG